MYCTLGAIIPWVSAVLDTVRVLLLNHVVSRPRSSKTLSFIRFQQVLVKLLSTFPSLEVVSI